MCILTFIPSGIGLAEPAIESLWNGGLNNPDGHGFALATPDGIVMGKSLRLDEALSDFIDARETYPDAPALFHSRYATHGPVVRDNCHPFYVGAGNQTVLAHNGVLPKAAHPRNGDQRSDTAIMAAELMPRQWHRLDKRSTMKSLTQFCGRGNKLVILTVDPRYKRSHYIVNESRGTWDSDTGLWHSNFDYLYSLASTQAQWTTGRATGCDWLDDPTVCDLCHGRVNDYGVCTVCGTCCDCYESYRDCLCHIPEHLRQLATGGR